MKIPSDADIPDQKLTSYLLIYKPRNDKSKFLAAAGFTEQNPDALKVAIQQLIDSAKAIEDGINEYGTFYRVDGEIVGINGECLTVTAIWIQRRIDHKFQFVTLKPFKESRKDA
ncbi:MAG: hypothetical protein DCF22_06445 [Leptolyngbya sp.]|nr:MAG: hypothetical protein DCF22_06445 [Leptolyngbya sp.]